MLRIAIVLFSLCASPALAQKTRTQNGFLYVPLDWNNPSEPLDLAYQIQKVGSSQKPYLFIVGAGPAMPSIGLYGNQEEGLAKYFNLVIYDQRGVGRSSYPGDVTPEMAVKFFGSPSQAKDLNALIDHLNPPGQPYYLFGNSYGTLIMTHFMSVASRKPAGVLQVSPALPLTPIEIALHERLRQQIELSQIGLTTELRTLFNQAVERIRELNADIPTEKAVGLNDLRAALTHYLPTHLYQAQVEQLLSDLIHTRTLSELRERLIPPPSASRLIYQAVSATEFYKKDWREVTLSKLQPESWMWTQTPVDEPPGLQRLRPSLDESEQAVWDLAPSHYVDLNTQIIRKAFRDTPVVTLLTKDDPFVPIELARKYVQRICPEKIHKLMILESGGHGAFFFPGIAKALVRSLRRKEERAKCENVF